MDYALLRNKIYNILLELATDEGINASGRDEIYGCIFGRDSAITILKILKVTENETSQHYYEVEKLRAICRRSLLTLISLQGKEHVLESGEQPGKFIHEYRKNNYDHLLKLEKPWYVYPDGILRNFDSLDSTPLTLIAIYKYWQQAQDNEFLLSALPAVEAGLNWIITYGDLDKDQLVEYELPIERKYGGLPVQSWTDSHESLMRLDGTMPLYPIAPVTVLI
jgi:glycogen debranching enzyme